MGERAFEQARISYGRPAADSELTEDYNPLEAGLQTAMSLTKVGTPAHPWRSLVSLIGIRVTQPKSSCLSVFPDWDGACWSLVMPLRKNLMLSGKCTCLDLELSDGYAGLFHWSGNAVQADQPRRSEAAALGRATSISCSSW